MMAPTDRRAVLATAEADPVFPAIEAHRAAWAAFDAANDRADEPLAREQGRTVTPADAQACEDADAAERAAMVALQEASPATIAGLKAALAYLIEWNDPGDTMEYLPALLRSPIFAG